MREIKVELMTPESFARTRRFSRPKPTVMLTLWLVGILSALPIIALLATLGLVTDLLASGGDVEVSVDRLEIGRAHV